MKEIFITTLAIYAIVYIIYSYMLLKSKKTIMNFVASLSMIISIIIPQLLMFVIEAEIALKLSIISMYVFIIIEVWFICLSRKRNRTENNKE